MAVYFAPSTRNYVSIGDLLTTIGGGLLNQMFARDAAAKQYKYNSRLAAEADSRKADAVAAANAERRGYIEMLQNGVNANPHQQGGAADFLGGAIGSGASLKELQNYWLPNIATVNTGDKMNLVPSWSNGTFGEEQSYDMGIDPAKAQALALEKDRMNQAQQQALWERDYKNRALSQEGAFRRASLNRERAAQIMPDGNGGMAWVDPYSKTITPAPGIRPSSAGGRESSPLEQLLIASKAYQNLYGKNQGGGGFMDEDKLSNTGPSPMEFLQMFGLSGAGGGAPQQGGNNIAANAGNDNRLNDFMSKTGMSREEAIAYLNSKKVKY